MYVGLKRPLIQFEATRKQIVQNTEKRGPLGFSLEYSVILPFK